MGGGRAAWRPCRVPGHRGLGRPRPCLGTKAGGEALGQGRAGQGVAPAPGDRRVTRWWGLGWILFLYFHSSPRVFLTGNVSLRQ